MTCATRTCRSSRSGRARARSSSRPSTSTTGPASSPACEHLCELGHERIALRQRPAAGRQLAAPGRLRRVHDRPLRRRPRRLRPAASQHRWPAARRPSQALLELPEPPTAVVTSTDLVAVGVLHAAYNLGRTRARRAVRRGLRRPAPRRPHGAGADDAADADRGDRRRGRRARRSRWPGIRRVARAADHGLRADAHRPPVDGAAASASGRGRRPGSPSRRRLTPVGLTGVLPSLGSVAVARPARPAPIRGVRRGIQTRIARTVRFAQAKYGIAPTWIGVGRLALARVRRVARQADRPSEGHPRAIVRAAATSDRARPHGRQVDLLELRAGRQVGRLDAVDERPALERDAAADRVDPRDPARSPGPACRASSTTGRRPATPASSRSVRARPARPRRRRRRPMPGASPAAPGRDPQRQRPRPGRRLQDRHRDPAVPRVVGLDREADRPAGPRPGSRRVAY